MKKFDSILSQAKDIEDFKVIDVDLEWNIFKEKIGELQSLPSTKVDEPKKSPIAVIFKKSTISLISIAASLILLLGFIFIFKSSGPDRKTIITVDNIEKINMIDGSKIELNQNSTIEYPVILKGVNERKINLVGSATFDVTRNEKLPFLVYYGDVLVEVLGTVFAISKKNGLTIVQNISGSVAVSQVLNRENKRILQKGETLLFQNGQFFNPKDTVQTIIEDRKIEVGVGQNAKPIRKKNNTSPETIIPTELKGSTFKLDNVIKNYIIKFNKKKLKLQKGTKFDKNTTVQIDINKTYLEVLQELKKQGHIDFKPGDCSDCFIITSATQ